LSVVCTSVPGMNLSAWAGQVGVSKYTDLVREMTEVLTSFCARLYGRRGARNRALRALGRAQAEAPGA